MSTSRQRNLLFASLALLCITTVFVSVALGSTEVSFKNFITAILSRDIHSPDYLIIMHVRLPRVIASLFAGSALAVSGAVIQAVLNNPLAGPNIIGVNSGAGLGAILAMSVLPAGSIGISAAAFIGALSASLIILAIASRANTGKVTIILAGVAISSILSALIDGVKTTVPDSALSSVSFMIGGFSGVSFSAIKYALCLIAPALIIAFSLSKSLDILSLGDATAKSLGANVALVRALSLICASILAGAAVSYAGLLGFVGLIVPHIIRRFTGLNNRLLLPASAMLGGILLTLSDLLARTLFAPYEIPVGIITSLVGGPFFLVMLARKKYDLD